jgi:hypothetical protein
MKCSICASEATQFFLIEKSFGHARHPQAFCNECAKAWSRAGKLIPEWDKVISEDEYTLILVQTS